MSSIKVTYGQISREITIASDTTWAEFESHLHYLFNIPNGTAISVSYTDEDGDIVTLSTDSELRQLLSDKELLGINASFNVHTSENPDDNGWVLENAQENDGSVTTLSDDETTNKDEVVAYKIGEPSEVVNVQTEEQQPDVTDYPHATVTDEKDDPLFEPTIPKEKESERQQEELLIPAESEKNSIPNDPSNSNEKHSSTFPKKSEYDSSTSPNKSEGGSSTPSKKSEDDSSTPSKKSENDSSRIIFIVSSGPSPWIQRNYYRPRVNLFGGLLSDHFTHFNHFAGRSYIRPSFGFRRHPYFSCDSPSRFWW